MTRLERSLVKVRTVITARSQGDAPLVALAQSDLDEWDRWHGYDRRRNVDLGATPQRGDKLRASTPAQRAQRHGSFARRAS